MIRYDSDADLSLLTDKTIAIIGYGSQGHAHALNLHDSGISVIVGLREGSPSIARAQSQGLRTASISEACKQADIIMLLAPDTRQPQIFEQFIAPHLAPGMTLMFAHGFNIRYGTIRPPEDIDISLIAPKSPGHRVRETYQAGAGTPCLLAVHNDASGQADATALAYAAAIGGGRAGILTTTFAEETETDLFGEQAVLCGGASALVKAGFETLVEAGYQPEVAYFECLHELKLIVDLMYRGGLSFMRYSISDTAEQGDYIAGERIIGEQTREEMRRLLADIQSGAFAEAWIAENAAGRPSFDARRRSEADSELERVGRKLRRMMPFVDEQEVFMDAAPSAAK